MISVFETYCSWFIVYSMIGWLYESILCSFMQKKVVNRGFLNGPYCPIYGFGALLDIIFLSKFENIAVLFLFGVILNCGLEYLTSFLMEKIFNARWWDYSDMNFNIHGRVCLLGAIVFGTFSVLLIKVIHPFVVWYINKIPVIVLHIIVTVFLIVFIYDNVITILAAIKLDEKLKEFADILEEKKANMVKSVNSYREETAEKLHEIRERIPANSMIYNSFIKTLNWQHRRIIKAFPRLKSIKYNDILSELKQKIYKRKSKKNNNSLN